MISLCSALFPQLCAVEGAPHPIFRPISAASPLSGLYQHQPPSLPRSVMCSSLTTIYNVIHHPLSVLRSRVTWSVVSQDLSVHIPNIPTAGHHGMDITVCGREGPLQVWCPLFTIMTAGGHIFRVSLLPCDVVLGVQSFSHYHPLHLS